MQLCGILTHNRIMLKFKERLRELRIDKGFSQAKLGEMLSYGRCSITDWETGRTQPSFEILVELSKIFNVSTDYLLGVED